MEEACELRGALSSGPLESNLVACLVVMVRHRKHASAQPVSRDLAQDELELVPQGRGGLTIFCACLVALGLIFGLAYSRLEWLQRIEGITDRANQTADDTMSAGLLRGQPVAKSEPSSVASITAVGNEAARSMAMGSEAAGSMALGSETVGVEIVGGATTTTEAIAAHVNAGKAGATGMGAAAELPAAEHRACSDVTPKCVAWASSGECTRNANYMRESCTASCGACEKVATPRPTLPQTSAKPCVDSEPGCVEWAASGECSRNPGYMVRTCKSSCDKCDLEAQCAFNHSEVRVVVVVAVSARTRACVRA